MKKVFIALIISLSDSDRVMEKTDLERRSRLSWAIKVLKGNRSQSGSLLTFVGVNAEVYSNQINKLVQTVVRPHEMYKWRLGMLSDRLSPKEFPMLHLQAKMVVHCCVCN